MKRIKIAGVLAWLAATVCLFFGDGWGRLSAAQDLMVVGSEAFFAVVAMTLAALAQRVIRWRARRDWYIPPALFAVWVGLVLGPVAGALMAVSAVLTLRAGLFESFWDGMVGISRMYGFAGGVGAFVFWLATGWDFARRRPRSV